MEKYIINTGTITYALRARDILRNNGYSAYMFRNSGKDTVGCGYAVKVTGNKNAIVKILNNAGIKYNSIKAGERL